MPLDLVDRHFCIVTVYLGDHGAESLVRKAGPQYPQRGRRRDESKGFDLALRNAVVEIFGDHAEEMLDLLLMEVAFLGCRPAIATGKYTPRRGRALFMRWRI